MTAEQIAAIIAYDLSDSGLTPGQRELIAEIFAQRLYRRSHRRMIAFIARCKRESERAAS